MGSSNLCSVCNLDDCDLQLQGCGCFFHVTCCPLSLILDGTKPLGANLPVGPVKDQTLVCGLCGSGPVSGVRVLPLSFEPLEKSVKLRLAASQHSSRSPKNSPVPQVSGQKRSRDDEVSEREIETEHVVFSMGKQALATNLSDSETQRTGRWGDEEVAFVDHLVNSFDHGRLPIPHGTKLSAFLGDLLMCKASRLTKKMKNAKLSARSFELVSPDTSRTDFRQDGIIVNKLQRNFIQSLATDYAQLEIGFNLSKHWRSFFSDLCLQVGYPFLDGSMYLASLEEYERRASLAEERMRNVRRKRMGFSIKTEESPKASAPLVGNRRVSALDLDVPTGTTSGSTFDHSDKVEDVFSEIGAQTMDNAHAGMASLDYLENSLTDFMDPTEQSTEDDSRDLLDASFGKFDIYPPVRQTRDPFLEAIAMYLEQYNLPFQHADVWVPSFVGNNDNDVHLLHAGYVTRRDQDGKLWSAFENFGEYSKGFTFTPGVGLVGRVYATGKTLWEFEVNELDPKVFLRAGGAKEYGVRTATGIPFSTPGVGRMVVILYSCNHIQENAAMAHQCAEELSRYSPEPKWKLVIEIGDQAESPPPVVGKVAPGVTGRSTPIEKLFAKELPKSITPREGSADFAIHEIISLLGEQLALHNRPRSLSDESSLTSEDSSTLFNEFMAIRLMLLRPESRRSTQENEVIDVLKGSYKAYSAGNKRSGSELATLLAREWLCLTGNGQSSFRSDSSLDQHPMNDHTVHVLMPSLKPLGTSYKGMLAPSMQLPSSKSKYPSSGGASNNLVVYDHSAGFKLPDTGVKTGRHTLPDFIESMRRTVSNSTLYQSNSVGGTNCFKSRSNSFVLNG
eukprot:Nitzschia sp. Nitz4//scaffold110_size71422//6088//8902//NITZ4_005863-RA/size71422-augustus-gene-0.11-mRNA-1//1//CDS//3329533056//7793//frame0